MMLSGGPGGLASPSHHTCLSQGRSLHSPPRRLHPEVNPLPGRPRTQEVGCGDVALPVRVTLLALPQELAPAALHPLPEPALDGLAVLQLWGAQRGAHAAGRLWAERERLTDRKEQQPAGLTPGVASRSNTGADRDGDSAASPAFPLAGRSAPNHRKSRAFGNKYAANIQTQRCDLNVTGACV